MVGIGFVKEGGTEGQERDDLFVDATHAGP